MAAVGPEPMVRLAQPLRARAATTVAIAIRTRRHHARFADFAIATSTLAATSARAARGMQHALTPIVDSYSYISSELIQKLRREQRYLRRSIDALAREMRQADVQQLSSQFHEFASLYRSHERLVGALLEAVEPDNPAGPYTQD